MACLDSLGTELSLVLKSRGGDGGGGGGQLYKTVSVISNCCSVVKMMISLPCSVLHLNYLFPKAADSDHSDG